MSAHEATAHHDAGGHHPAGTRLYWTIGAILAVVTILEVAITFVPIPHALIVAVLLILSVIKGALVVMFFMHLKGDPGIFTFVFISPFILAISMALIFLVLFSGHSGIAG